MNYTELVAQVKGYMENEFPTSVGYTSEAQLDSFIVMAEQDIQAAVRLPHLRGSATLTLAPNDATAPVPRDFQALESAQVVLPGGRHSFLRFKHVSFIREAFPDPAYAAIPEYVSVLGPEPSQTFPYGPTTGVLLMFGPTPDQAYPVDMHYVRHALSITDVSNKPAGTTWLSEHARTALVFGALANAAAFMHNDELAGHYKGQFEKAMALLGTLGTGAQGTIA